MYEVTVDHLRKIRSVTCGFAGSVTDKSIQRLDRFLDNLKVQPVFTNYRFSIYSGNDSEKIDVLGAYVIVDGGYVRWRYVRWWMRRLTFNNDGNDGI